MQQVEDVHNNDVGLPQWSPPSEEKVAERKQRTQQRIDILRAEYREDRRAYDAVEHKQAEHFSKSMLTVGVAALGFSLSFSQWVGEGITHTGALTASWLFFAATSLLVILSFYNSNSAFRLAKQYADAKYDLDEQECRDKLELYRLGKLKNDSLCKDLREKAQDLKEKVDGLGDLVGGLNLASFAAFLGGLLFLLIFAHANLPS